MSELSEAAANSINTWSTIVSIVAAVTTALTAYTAFWSNGILKRYSDEKITAAAAVAGGAQEEVAHAQADIAKANEGAERARADAAQARLETVQISARLEDTKAKLNAANLIQPLSAELLYNLKISLTGYKIPPGANISPSAPNDREAEYIAEQIDHALTEAGIPRTLGEGVDSYVPTGNEHGRIMIAYGSAIPVQLAEDLAARFTEAGLDANVTKLKRQINNDIENVQQSFIFVQVVPTPKPPY